MRMARRQAAGGMQISEALEQKEETPVNSTVFNETVAQMGKR